VTFFGGSCELHPTIAASKSPSSSCRIITAPLRS
jgi:hypothetical protein